MPKNLDQTGVLQVNGAWATSVKYESEVLGARAGTVDVRFMQGRAEIARVSLLTEEVAQLLGDKNAATITRHLAGDADKYLALIKGELRGTRLHYREVRLEENAIEADRDRRLDTSGLRTTEGAVRQSPDATSNSAAGPARPDPAPESRPAGAAEPEREPGANSRTGPVPPHIVAKYLVKHDKYYFDDQTVAFVDRGSRLTAQTQNSAVLKDQIEIAKTREWQDIHVTGTQAFRREAWKEAHAADLKVSGYTPSEIELEAANRARSRAGEARTSRAPPGKRGASPTGPSTDGPGSQPGAPGRPVGRRSADPARGLAYGVLIDHGVARYRSDPSKSASYFVTIKDEAGVERTHWGVGLAAAIRQAESSPKIGDEIGIRRLGSMPVTVVGREGEGQAASSPIAAKRHQWQIETTQYLKDDPSFRELSSAQPPKPSESVSTPGKATVSPSGAMTPSQEAAAAMRSASTTREELQLNYPEINRAVFQTLAAHEQFADAYIKARLIRESDRARVIAQLRERVAADLDRGKPIREPQGRVNAIVRNSVYEAATRIGRAPVDQGRHPTATGTRRRAGAILSALTQATVSSLLMVAALASAHAATPVDPSVLGQAQAFLAAYSDAARAQSSSFYDLYSNKALVHVRADGQAHDAVFEGRAYKAWSRKLLLEHRLAIDDSRFANATVEQRGGRLLIRAKRYSGNRCFWDLDYQVSLEGSGSGLRIVDERLAASPTARCERRPAAVPTNSSSFALGKFGAIPAPPRWQPQSQAELEQTALRLAQEAASSHRGSSAIPSTAPVLPVELSAATSGRQRAKDELLQTPP